MGFFTGSMEESAFKGLKLDRQFSIGAHNTMIGIANNGYVGSAFTGAAGGAVLGGINGGISDDDTVLGGAFRGAGSGAMLGIGARAVAGAYSVGARDLSKATKEGSNGFVSEANGVFSDTYGSAFSANPGIGSPFRFSNIMDGAFSRSKTS